MDEEKKNTEEHDKAREEKEDNAETKEEAKEETDGNENEQQEEEDKKNREEECIETNKDSPRVSSEAPKREATDAFTALSTPVKKKMENKDANPSIFQNKKEHKNQTREATNINKNPY